MKPLLPLLCLATAAAVGATTWKRLAADGLAALPAPAAGTASPAAPATPDGPLAGALRAARRTCEVAALDDVVRQLQAATAARPADAAAWHLLAEAHLERALLRSHDRGLAVGTPTFPQLPAALRADLDAGLAAAKTARQLGDDGSDLFRIEAGLMSQHITGLASALQWNGRIQDALQRAAERARQDPHLHVALGLRKLLAPKLLGHDPQQALAHFEFAAQALADDERPAVFAAMASYLQQKRQQAIAWLEQAVARNDNNRFARVVLARLRAGEPDPFGRDVTLAEASARK